MKILPCRPAQGGRGCGTYATLSDGTPHRIGRAPDFRGREPFRYKCARCKLVTALRAEDFARLPEATFEELRQLGLGWAVERDLRGHGVTKEEIEHLDSHGPLETAVRLMRARAEARAPKPQDDGS